MPAKHAIHSKEHTKHFMLIALILIVALTLYTIVTGQQFFTYKNVNMLNVQIGSFGPFAPLIFFALIVLSTLIPPLPIPIPLIEIVAGQIFGFVPAVILIWISHMCASLAAFGVSRYFQHRFITRIFHHPFFNVYTHLIKKRGALGVFAIRAVMAAPFNISFIAGVTRMDVTTFSLATGIGILPEVLTFVYIGTLASHTSIRLWYIFILLVVMAVIPLVMYTAAKLLRRSNAPH